MAQPLEGSVLALVSELAKELRPRALERGVTRDTLLERDLGLDSLARAELLYRMERRFGVRLPDHLLVTAQTPGDLLEALSAPAMARPGAVTFAPLAPPEGPGAGSPAGATTLLEALDWHVAAHPDRPHLYLLDEGGTAVPYSALAAAARAVAGGLWEQGLRPGQTVGVMLPTGRDYFSCFLGTWLAGGVPVPIYPPARPAQLEEHLARHAGILGNAQASFLIAPPEAKGLARSLEGRVAQDLAVATPGELAAGPAAAAICAPRPEDVALLQYTSGSTGDPKGVVLTHAHLLANIRAMGQAIEVTADDVFVSWLPLYHDMGLIGAWLGSLYFGMRLGVMSPLAFLARPGRWLQAISDLHATLSAAPNFAYELCLGKIPDEELSGLDLAAWRMALNGAEPVSPETIARFAARFGARGFRPEAMAPVYGLAEAGVGLAFPPVDRGPVVDRIRREVFMRAGQAEPAPPSDLAALRFVSCGLPLPGYEIRILDPRGGDVPEREVGRIVFRGPSATAGYFRDPARTRKLFRDGWLDTGDLGYLADSELFVTGREKDVIIKAGRNIVPQELEEAAGGLPGVRKGCVAAFGSPDPATGSERLILVVETREAASEALRELDGRIRQLALDLLGVPLDDLVLARPHAIPKTSSGKIRRAACRERFERGQAARPVGLPWPAWSLVARVGLDHLVRALRRSWRRAAAFGSAGFAWAAFGAVALPVWLAVWLVPDLASRRRLAAAALRLVLRLAGIRVSAPGLGQLRDAGPCVVVANHFSYLDGPLLAAYLGPRFDFVATGQLLEERLKRPLLRRLGVRFVAPRDPAAAVREAGELESAVRAGRPIVVFPEGNLARPPGLRPFHMGAFLVAARAGVPIVPVAIRGTRGVLRPYSWFPRRGDVSITTLAPIFPDGGDWAAALRLRERARAEILRHCGEPALE